MRDSVDNGPALFRELLSYLLRLLSYLSLQDICYVIATKFNVI
jgi:hypothetical protein